MSALLTVAEAAAELRVDKQTVYRMIWSGELRVINVGLGTVRRRLRVERAAIDEMLRPRRVAARPAVPS